MYIFSVDALLRKEIENKFYTWAEKLQWCKCDCALLMLNVSVCLLGVWFDILMEGGWLWVVMRGFLGAGSSSSISQRAGDGCDGLQEEPLPSIPIALSSTSSSSPASSSVSSIISFISTRMSTCMNTSVSIRGNIALVTEPSRPLSSIPFAITAEDDWH